MVSERGIRSAVEQADRCSGRTTRMLLSAASLLLENPGAEVWISARGTVEAEIYAKCLHGMCWDLQIPKLPHIRIGRPAAPGPRVRILLCDHDGGEHRPVEVWR